MGHVQGIIDSRTTHEQVTPTTRRYLNKTASKRDFLAAIGRGIQRFDESPYIKPNLLACAQYVRQSVDEAGFLVTRKRNL